MKENTKGEIQIFQKSDGETSIEVTFNNETVWLNEQTIARLFGRERTTINRHIRNVFKEGELEEKSNVQKMHIANSDKPVNFYNLDVIISIGYRVKSNEGTKFRIWANKILKEYLIQGYSINEKRLKETGLKELDDSINLIKNALGSGDLSRDEALGLLDIITGYTNSWLLLQKYDENELPEMGNTKKLDYKLEAKEAYEAVLELKKKLIASGEATDLFGKIKSEDGIEAIFGNIYQTFGGVDLYETTEEKAANLLYFLVKDHPFADGNKRSGAFLFILFLSQNNILFDENNQRKINDRALVAITLLIASSNPKDKDLMVKLVMNLIN